MPREISVENREKNPTHFNFKKQRKSEATAM